MKHQFFRSTVISRTRFEGAYNKAITLNHSCTLSRKFPQVNPFTCFANAKTKIFPKGDQTIKERGNSKALRGGERNTASGILGICFANSAPA